MHDNVFRIINPMYGESNGDVGRLLENGDYLSPFSHARTMNLLYNLQNSGPNWSPVSKF